MTTFNFQCFACQAVLRAKTKLCGSTIDCPKCGAALIVPDYSPPVSAPSGPPLNVFQPNLPITVDDDEPIGGSRGRKKRGGVSVRDAGSVFFSVLGAVSFVLLVLVLLMQNRQRTQNGQAIEIRTESLGSEYIQIFASFLMLLTHLAAFSIPLMLAIRGCLSTVRWFIMSIAFFTLSGITFFTSFAFISSILNLPESDFTRSVTSLSFWFVLFSTWFGLAAIGSLFGAAVHGVGARK